MKARRRVLDAHDSTPTIRTNLPWFAGQVMEVNLPKLTVKMEEHRDGGMDAPAEIDMGLEKLECNFSTSRIDAGLLRSWGLAPGNLVPLTFSAARSRARTGP